MTYYEEQIAKYPFRIQGVNSCVREADFHTNKGYATFEQAQHAAGVQSCNAVNISKGNKFIVYKAIAIVGPANCPVETIMLDSVAVNMEST